MCCLLVACWRHWPFHQRASTSHAPSSASCTWQVSLDGYLTVDPASLAALQIFQEEAHPAAAMGIGETAHHAEVAAVLNCGGDDA